MDDKDKRELDEILYLALENTATSDQIKTLIVLMETNSDIMHHVLDYYFIAGALRKSNSVVNLPDTLK